MTKFLNISTDNTLGGSSASDVVVSSQKAIKDYVDSHGGSVSIDNTTITTNSNSEIQAVATKNANSASGATGEVFDWIGTLSEYETQDIAATHPDWVCYITDDFTAQAYDAYSKAESNSLYVPKGFDIIEFQVPTSLNNYTWYKKYRNGWVEMGGHYTHNNVEGTVTITFPVTMADTHYTITMAKELGSDAATNMNYQFMCAYVMNSKTTTSFQIRMTGANRLNGADWEVKGMAA